MIHKASNLLVKDTILVEFSILRSATYEVPVLWLTLTRLPPGATNGIAAVYEHLVPESTRPGLRQMGVMGGISIAVRRQYPNYVYC